MTRNENKFNLKSKSLFDPFLKVSVIFIDENTEYFVQQIKITKGRKQKLVADEKQDNGEIKTK